MKKHGFVRGAVILAAAGVVCRLLGVLFRIPLSNIVGNFGIGLYQLVFPLYSLLLIISSAGVPVAISKIVARARDDRPQCKRILFNALISLGIVGLIISAAFAIFAVQIARLQGNADIWLLYTAISPAVFLVCFISAFRGYFQGLSDMAPTAISQVVEQIIKVGVGLTLAVIFIKQSILMAVFGAILAVSVSELVAVIVLWFIYLWKERRGTGATKKPPKSSAKTRQFSWRIVKQIFITSAPITLMSLTFPLVLMFDSFFIVNALTAAGTPNPTELYGIASGAVHTLINLPTVVGIAIATSIIPMVSRAFKRGETADMKKKAKSAIWLILGFSVLAAAAMAVFAPLILKILYSKAFESKPAELDIAVLLLRIESAAVVLICMTQVMGSILQGVDKSKYPLIALAVGGAAKIAFEIFTIKTMGITAVSISNVLCFAAAFIINSAVLIKFMRKRK